MTESLGKGAGRKVDISNWPFTVKFMAPSAAATALMAILTGGAIYIMNGQWDCQEFRVWACG